VQHQLRSAGTSVGFASRQNARPRVQGLITTLDGSAGLSLVIGRYLTNKVK
jgi:hypothetical protein